MIIKKIHFRIAFTLFETLIIITILSLCLSPTFYILRQLQPVSSEIETQLDIIATLIAHHILETIIAQLYSSSHKCLPEIISSEQQFTNSKYFETIKNALSNSKIVENHKISDKILSTLEKFKIKIENYFLDNNLFKLVITIKYNDIHENKKIIIDRVIKLESNE